MKKRRETRMPLDPQVQTLLDQMAALNAPPIYTLTPELVHELLFEQRCRQKEPAGVADAV
jgi:hypothetical protein